MGRNRGQEDPFQVTRLRLAEEGRGGHVRPHIHLVRHDGVVHVVKYTEGPSVIVLDARNTPVADEFRMDLWCGRSVKMYLGGRNRITKAYPTCVRCVTRGGS